MILEQNLKGSEEVADKIGWIRIHRKIQDCWIWEIDKPFDERSAWIDLLLLANHKDVKIPFNGELTLVKRSQLITSVRKFEFCPYCGKKIKVAPYQPKGE